MLNSALYPFCGLEDKTMGIVLWTCPSARNVWLLRSKKLQKIGLTYASFVNIVVDLLARLDR